MCIFIFQIFFFVYPITRSLTEADVVWLSGLQKCCNMLQCVAAYLSVAMCCNVLQCVAMCCNVLQRM